MLTASRVVLDHLKLGSSELFLAVVAGRVFHRRGGPKRTRDCLGLSSTDLSMRYPVLRISNGRSVRSGLVRPFRVSTLTHPRQQPIGPR